MRHLLTCCFLTILIVPASPAADNPIPVRVRPPSRIQQPARVAASGSVDTEATVNLAFQVAGRIRRVLVEEGHRVRKGQVVAELDPTDYQLGVEAAKAQTAAARAQSAKAQAGPRKQDVELARIQDALRTATAVPLRTTEVGAEVLELAQRVVLAVNRNVISDAGAAALSARAGAEASALNVRINLAAIKDPAYTSTQVAALEALLARAERSGSAVLTAGDASISR